MYPNEFQAIEPEGGEIVGAVIDHASWKDSPGSRRSVVYVMSTPMALVTVPNDDVDQSLHHAPPISGATHGSWVVGVVDGRGRAGGRPVTVTVPLVNVGVQAVPRGWLTMTPVSPTYGKVVDHHGAMSSRRCPCCVTSSRYGNVWLIEVCATHGKYV